MHQLVLLVAFLILPACHAQAQVNYAGKDFWLTLGGATGPGTIETGFSMNGRLNIGSRHTATVSLYFTSTGQTQIHTIPADSVVTIPFTIAMNQAVSNFRMEQIDNKSLHITSDSDIVVDYFDALVKASDGTAILPTDNQQKADSFYLVSVPPGIIRSSPEARYYPFSIVATCDSVDVEITPLRQTYSHPAGIPFSVRLRKGETYQLGTYHDAGPALTGTKIKATAGCCRTPVNIFHHMNGYYADIKGGSVCCIDNPLEQVLPADRFDTAYPVVSWARNPYSMLRIFSAADNNRVYFDKLLVRTMARGEVFDTLITDAAVMVHSAKPVSLGQFMLSNSAFPNPPAGDPEIMYNASVKQGIRESLFSTIHVMGTPLIGTPEPSYHYLTVMSRKKNVASVTLNGQKVDGHFRNFYTNPEWQYAYIPLLPNRTYHLKSDERVVAYYYFLVSQGSYSHNLPDIVVDSQVLNDGMPIAGAKDTLYKCAGESATLAAGAADLYEWSTGAAAPEISVTDTGYYWVKETHIRPCVNPYQKHEFYVMDLDTTTLYEHYDDTVYKCGASVDLVADEAESYIWNTGQTAQQISVTDTGTYRVTGKKAVSPCRQAVVTHTYYVKDRIRETRPDIGNDTTICEGGYLILQSGTGTVSWSTGDTGTSLMVRKSGLYRAMITDSCGNIYIDSVTVHMEDCSRQCNVNFPTAFTPNGDGKNDVFRPIGAGIYSSYYITIYNRWGELMFASHDAGEGWNGMYQGGFCPVGVYMYICTVDCDNMGKTVFRGDITLVR